MKKYISLLSIAGALIMQSCERSDSNYDIVSTEYPTSPRQERDNAGITLPSCGGSTNDLEPGGDNEPERDKQHWRTPNYGQ